ncbi:MAG: cation:proton antiporter domain-containing protein, partial [Mycobacteriaceae bacterium]
MTFSTLAVISLIGLLGPMLTLRKSWPIPLVLGELLAGVVFGNSGFGFLHPSSEAFTFLADIGFVLIMFVVGTHVPVQAPLIRSALRIGAARAALVGLLATAGGIGIAYATDTGHPALFAVLLASSSAAFVLPLLDSVQLKGTSALQL